MASVALVAGLTLPLLSSGAPSDPAAAPPASEHAGGALAPDGQNNPRASADQPAAVAAANHGPARGTVTLLADRTVAAPGMPVQLAAPAQPAGVAGPVLQIASPAGDPVHRQAGTGYPGPGQQAGPPPPSIYPDPQSEYEREQLARLARLLAQLPSSPAGTTAPGSSTSPKSGGGIFAKGGTTPPKTVPSAPKNVPSASKGVPASPGSSSANFGNTRSSGPASVNRTTTSAGSGSGFGSGSSSGFGSGSGSGFGFGSGGSGSSHGGGSSSGGSSSGGSSHGAAK